MDRAFRYNLFFILLGIIFPLICILSLEYIARYYIEPAGQRLQDHPQLNHIWKPNSRSTHMEWIVNNPEYRTPYVHYYNKQAWIEKYDVEIEKPMNSYRAFYLGDSFMQGTVPMELSLPSQVETYLNALDAESEKTYEIINTGTTSYSPVLYYILIRNHILKYSPDLIVINVDMTDDFDDWKYSQNMKVDEEGNPMAAPPRDISIGKMVETEEGFKKISPLMSVSLYLYEHSALYNLLRVLRKAPPSDNLYPVSNKKLPYYRWAWCDYDWDEKVRNQVNFTLDILDRIILLTKKNNVPLILMSTPHYEQYLNGTEERPVWSTQPHKEIQELCEKHDVLFFDAHEALRSDIEGSERTDFYYYGDMHFNPKGYQIWGKKHISFIQQNSTELRIN